MASTTLPKLKKKLDKAKSKKKLRLPTKPSASALKKRMQSKKLRSIKKEVRKKPDLDS